MLGAIIGIMDHTEQLRQFESFLTEKALHYFPLPSLLNEAIHYSLLSGGKRVRPLLCLGFCDAFNGNRNAAMVSAVAVEMVHAYSLIHDDLPAMDNDDLRRGKPTNHKVFGEAHAILSGDSLMSMSCEFFLKESSKLKIPSDKIITLLTRLLEASGSEGMVKGQSLDMDYGSKDLSKYDKQTLEKLLTNIHILKTGSIISWSCLAGLVSLDDDVIIKRFQAPVESLGKKIGLLFQIVDDILDATSEVEALGKTPGKDQKSGKLTYTGLYGLTEARAMASALSQSIFEDFEILGSDRNWKTVKNIVNSLEEKINIKR